MDEAKESWKLGVQREQDYPGLIWHDTTGRAFLQDIGNNARNLFGDSFWVDQVLPHPAPPTYPGYEQAKVDADRAALSRMYPDIDVVVITDCRYPNEAERVKDLGGKVIEIVRPGIESDGHASEQPLPEHLVDWTITNDGSLDDLRERTLEALSETGVV